MNAGLWFLPAPMIPLLATIATAAETLFGLLLVLGWKTRVRRKKPLPPGCGRSDVFTPQETKKRCESEASYRT
jgi:hypothetical protein